MVQKPMYVKKPLKYDFAPQPFPKFPFIFSSARLIVFQQTGRGERQEKMYYDIWLYLLGRRLTLNHSNLKPSLFIPPPLSLFITYILLSLYILFYIFSNSQFFL